MPSLEQVKIDYPNLRVIENFGDSEYSSFDADIAYCERLLDSIPIIAARAAGQTDLNSNPDLDPEIFPDLIEPPHEVIISYLLSQDKFTALALFSKHNGEVRPIEGHYYFFVDNITASNKDKRVVAYIEKEELDNLRAQSSLKTILASNNYLTNLAKLFRTADFDKFSGFFNNPAAICKSFLPLKQICYSLHTAGFLTNKSLNFMHEKFHDYLTLEDLCNLRLVCKTNKDLPVIPFTAQKLSLS